MLTGLGVSIIPVIGTGCGQHGAYNCDVSWLVEKGKNVSPGLDQMTVVADQDARSRNGTPVGRKAII